MKNQIKEMILAAILMGLTAPLANAGDRENEIVAGCVARGGGPYAVAACTGGLLTAQEADTCISTPNQCFGQNNTLRIILTNPGQAAEDLRDSIERSDLNPGNWRW